MIKLTIAILLLVTNAFGQGVDRWGPKTLKDGFIPGVPVASSIEHECSIKPAWKWTRTLPRQDSEEVVTLLRADLVACGVEPDSDFHLVLRDGARTMIAEIPKPEFANPKEASYFAAARQAVEILIGHYPGLSIKPLAAPIAVMTTGVRFFDMPGHNGQGHAGNEVEQHPLLKIIRAGTPR